MLVFSARNNPDSFIPDFERVSTPTPKASILYKKRTGHVQNSLKLGLQNCCFFFNCTLTCFRFLTEFRSIVRPTSFCALITEGNQFQLAATLYIASCFAVSTAFNHSCCKNNFNRNLLVWTDSFTHWVPLSHPVKNEFLDAKKLENQKTDIQVVVATGWGTRFGKDQWKMADCIIQIRAQAIAEKWMGCVVLPLKVCLAVMWWKSPCMCDNSPLL